MLQIGRIYRYIFTNSDIVYMLVTDFDNDKITGLMFNDKFEFDSMFTIDIRNKERMKSVGYVYDNKTIGIKLFYHGISMIKGQYIMDNNNIKKQKSLYFCSVCGSDDIEIKMWVNPNTNELVDDIDTNCWCHNCEEETKIKVGDK